MIISPVYLRSFCAVAQVRSFSRAAETLNLSQAAVSQHIQRLEQSTGPLLLRSTRKLELTPAGLALLDYAQSVQAAEKRLQSSLEAQENHSGEFTLMCPGSVGLLLYPALLNWQFAHTDLSISMRFAPTADIVHALLQQQVELGIVSQKIEHPSLRYERLGQEALCLVTPKAHQSFHWQSLCELGFIDHPDGQAMASRLLSRLYPGESLLALPCRGFINQISLILEPVALGLGFTILPFHAVKAYAFQDKLQVHTTAQWPADTLYLSYRKEWPLSARASTAIELIRSVFLSSVSS
jgi:DNA-binding transcriptional LysR family regulator